MDSGEGGVAAPKKTESNESLLDQSRLGDRDKMREAWPDYTTKTGKQFQVMWQNADGHG